MNLSGIEVITFDCYGTLIDWETGILNAVKMGLGGVAASDTEILAAYSEVEPKIQAEGYMSYRAVLRRVLQLLAEKFRSSVSAPDALAESISDWQPFPDTVPALSRLNRRFKLAVISNIDDDLFAGSAKRLEVRFDEVITAQQVGSYKPSLRNFEAALDRLAIDKSKLLHVAESLFHDIAPTNQLGIANVWVNRRGDRTAAASKSAEAKSGLMVPDLKTLADHLAGC